MLSLLLKGSAQDIEKSPRDEGASVPRIPKGCCFVTLTVFYKRLRKLRRLAEAKGGHISPAITPRLGREG